MIITPIIRQICHQKQECPFPSVILPPQIHVFCNLVLRVHNRRYIDALVMSDTDFFDARELTGDTMMTGQQFPLAHTRRTESFDVEIAII